MDILGLPLRIIIALWILARLRNWDLAKIPHTLVVKPQDILRAKINAVDYLSYVPNDEKRGWVCGLIRSGVSRYRTSLEGEIYSLDQAGVVLIGYIPRSRE